MFSENMTHFTRFQVPDGNRTVCSTCYSQSDVALKADGRERRTALFDTTQNFGGMKIPNHNS